MQYEDQKKVGAQVVIYTDQLQQWAINWEIWLTFGTLNPKRKYLWVNNLQKFDNNSGILIIHNRIKIKTLKTNLLWKRESLYICKISPDSRT